MSELVPELHDVLKMTTLPHSIYQWDADVYSKLKPYFPNTATWRGVRQHHKKEEFQEYPSDVDTFYLCIADDLASSLSRAGPSGSVQRTLRRLWRQQAIPAEKLQDMSDWIELLQFLQRDPTWEQFLQQEKYCQILRQRPEDEHEGRNIVSLYTHCKLTGQFYRILRGGTECIVDTRDLQQKTREQVVGLITGKEEKEWKLTVARCKFRFFAQPFRARDLNLFIDLDKLGQEIEKSYPDNVLLRTSDEMLLVVAEEKVLEDIAERAASCGFWIAQGKERCPLRELDKATAGLEITKNVYGSRLAETIFPICDLCQAAEATKSWPQDYIVGNKQLCPDCQKLLAENPVSAVIESLCEADKQQLEDVGDEPLREDLCSICFSRRAGGVRLRKLAAWTREPGAKVAWLRLKLEVPQLIATLRELHPFKSEVRFSVISEFQQDYADFVRNFDRALARQVGSSNAERVMNDFWCLRLSGYRDALSLLRPFKELMEVVFPAFLDNQVGASPIKIAIVCADAKFPFFKVWGVLEETPSDILISIEDRRSLKAHVSMLNALLAATSSEFPKGALHKLARVEETSKKLAQAVFEDRQDKDADTYARLAESFRPTLDFASIFTLARLLED